MPEKYLPDLAEARVKDIFLDAMLNGWAHPNTHKGTIEGLPGSTCIKFEKDGFAVIDCYYSNPGSDLSSGHTLIAYEGIPVWAMHYDGFYKKQAMPFLMAALLDAYVARQFIGGRGAACRSFDGGRLVYVNEVDEASCFASFSGKEYVYGYSGPDRICLGTHRYFGHALIELK
jgi:hypothetical protein